MIHRYLGQRVVINENRYIWRGKVEEVDLPFVLLSDVYQVITHSAIAITEEIACGERVIYAPAMFSCGPEAGTTWCNIRGR